MREIKFRAWDGSKMWIVSRIDFTGENKPIGWMRFEDDGEHPSANAYLHDVQVMQFTGLKDKNGKEIYEGDIMRLGTDGDDQVDVVEYCGDKGYPAFDFKGNTMESNGLSTFAEAGDTFEVIGNIYESPELLKA